MKPKRYPSDLTLTQWKRLKRLLPPAKPGGRPRSVDLREVLNALFYHLRAGGAWRLLPHDFPPWSTVYDYFRKWRNDGTWERIHARLREDVRLEAGRPPTPAAGVLDSQSVKTTHRGGERGYDAGKKNQRPQAALAGGHAGADLGGGGDRRQPVRQGRGAAAAGDGAAGVAAPAAVVGG